jgi:hypothetical protein
MRCQPGSGSPLGRVRRSGWVSRSGVIDKLRCSAALGADRLAGRVRGIGIEPGEAAILDGRNGATAGDAQAAEALHPTRRALVASLAAGFGHDLHRCTWPLNFAVDPAAGKGEVFHSMGTRRRDVWLTPDHAAERASQGHC